MPDVRSWRLTRVLVHFFRVQNDPLLFFLIRALFSSGKTLSFPLWQSEIEMMKPIRGVEWVPKMKRDSRVLGLRLNSVAVNSATAVANHPASEVLLELGPIRRERHYVFGLARGKRPPYLTVVSEGKAA
jgi:hypothetical protein